MYLRRLLLYQFPVIWSEPFCKKSSIHIWSVDNLFVVESIAVLSNIFIPPSSPSSSPLKRKERSLSDSVVGEEENSTKGNKRRREDEGKKSSSSDDNDYVEDVEEKDKMATTVAASGKSAKQIIEQLEEEISFRDKIIRKLELRILDKEEEIQQLRSDLDKVRAQ